MTSSSSTYVYPSGSFETFSLRKGSAEGHVIAEFRFSDGRTVDGYVGTAWLRERLDEIDPQEEKTRSDITADDIWRACDEYEKHDDMYAGMRAAIETALSVTPPRLPHAEDIEDSLIDAMGVGVLTDDDFTMIADKLAEKYVPKEIS